MWMADQRRVRRVWLALIQQGLKPSHGSIEEEGFDSVGHIIFYHRGQRGTRRRAEPIVVHVRMNDWERTNRTEVPQILLFPLCSSVFSVVKLVILSTEEMDPINL